MESKKYLNKYKSEYFLYLIFTVGIIGHIFQPLLNILLWLTPITLFLTGSVVLLNAYKFSSKKFLIWATITYVITFTLEVVGVKTSLIFGEYYYGNTLGLKVFEVPLIIGFNWLFVILGSISVSQLISKNKIIIAIISACISVLFDFVLEPVAIKLNYWQWADNIIPVQNYIAWFFIAFISVLIFSYLSVNVKSKIGLHYLVIQFVFFLLIQIFG
ncbi:MAG: carotenoid biosynthesis protein [Ignavibacteriota bacterium]